MIEIPKFSIDVRQDKKGQKTNMKEKIIAMIALVVITIVFSGLICNKYFPITEGWFQDYARYILQGKFIYRDFYCPVPPGYIWLSTLICRCTNYSFLALRIYGIIERILLILIVFELLSKVYSYKVTFFAVLVGSVIYSSTNTDLFYGYYQSSLLCAMIMLYFGVRMYESTNNSRKYAILYGLFAGITFCMKQNTGAFFAVFIGLGYILLMRKIDLKKSIFNVFCGFLTAMSVLAILAIVLAANKALIPFVEQVICGTSSKGSLISIFTAGIFRMIYRKSGYVFISALVLIFVLWLDSILQKKEKIGNYYSLLGHEISAAFWGAAFFVAYFKWFKLFYTADFLKTRASWVAIGMIISSIVFLAVFLALADRTITFKGVNLNILFYVASMCYFVAFFIYFFYRENIYTDWKAYIQCRQYLMHGLFFINLIIVLYRLILVRKTIDIRAMLYLASLSLMYIHGMSYILEEHGTLLMFSMLIADLLSNKTTLNWIKNIIVALFGVFTVLSICVQKNNYTYNWWGVNTLESSYKAVYSYDDPKLQGIKGDQAQTEALNSIYKLINDNKRENDTMYTFPHINYFNVMADLNSPAFCKVHYFDVCSDKQAISDAKQLEEDLPTFIIWQELSKSDWVTHEEIFRNGNPSGQRKLREFVYKKAKNGTYKLIGKYQFNQSSTIYVWGLDDGREWKIENIAE